MKRIVVDLELPKIIVTKLQTVITFDREVGWRRVKNESCSKRGNESSCQFLRRSATRGLPRKSPILVLLSPKNASLRSSDGIRCISAGMIAPVKCSAINAYMGLQVGFSFKWLNTKWVLRYKMDEQGKTIFVNCIKNR